MSRIDQRGDDVSPDEPCCPGYENAHEAESTLDAMSTSSDRLVAGLVGDRYQVTGLIASGGMGSVYRAHDTVLERTVALKVLKEGGDDPAFVARFRTEATNAARLSHPNIVQIYDFGATDGTPYMAMEYVDGQTLREILTSEGRLAPDAAIAIATQVAAALEHARRGGIVHRDVKPENILITTDGHVKVADFGLSRARAESRATQAGMLMGTAQYLAPEQVRDGFADHRSDVYALGVVLYEMLTGVPPFTGDSPVVVAYRHVAEDVPSVLSVRADVPRALDQVVARATARDADGRFPTAFAFGEALRAIASKPAELGSLARHTTAIPIEALQTVALPGARRPPARTRASKRRALILAMIGALAASILGVNALRTAPVPRVVGATQEIAKLRLERAGFHVDVTLRNDPDVASGTVLEQQPRDGASARRGTTVRVVVSLGPELLGLLDVRGEPFADAEAALRAKGFQDIVRVDAFSADVAKLAVIAQDPDPGLLIARSKTITLTVSKGPEFVAVPDVVGDPEAGALADLRAAGLVVTITRQETLSVPAGQVISQTPAPGKRAAKGSKASLVISKSPPPVRVPDLRCMTQRQAADALGQAGFRASFSGKGKRVVDQSPAPSDTAPRGSTITVYMGFGHFC